MKRKEIIVGARYKHKSFSNVIYMGIQTRKGKKRLVVISDPGAGILVVGKEYDGTGERMREFYRGFYLI